MKKIFLFILLFFCFTFNSFAQGTHNIDTSNNDKILGDFSNGDYIKFTSGGTVIFQGTSGLPTGEISVKSNATATTLNSAAKVQVTVFDTNGRSIETTSDHTQDHIYVYHDGYYSMTGAIHVQNNAAQSHIVDVAFYTNNGVTEIENSHSERSLDGGSGDIASMNINASSNLSAGDTVELWAITDSAEDRSVTFSYLTINILQIGGGG